ncbi:uncharacterized protein LOC127705371 [Mytilus californianus]|uniref:uncharacterized protein LOC127705371 n=1 Tax=Mytilus californianus TaxID=6549 RepID=UPI00224509F8|nr:uncharacterized protein LOC127705371 [Mytilus californianus]XP_052065635.1 uncharacterized protein LOC127705371 [Mytilus californianus]
MASNSSLCALCDLRHFTISSTHWCPECEEALCINCKEHHSLSKSSRNHHVIPISEYISLPSCIANIDLFCTYHNEKYLQYCVKHACPICYKCIKEHGKCSELILLEELTHEVKSSEVFRDMEQSLKDIMININRIREDRKSNSELIHHKKKQIIEEVSRLKSQIIQRLDKLQEDLIEDLHKVENECCVKIASIVSSVNDQDEEIIQCNTEIENMKKYASDIQAFLGMREIQKKITKNEKCIESMVVNKKIERVDLEYTIDASIQDFLINVMTFGSITIKKSPTNCNDLVSKKNRQAQILATEKENVHNIKLILKRNLKTSCGNTMGGCVTDKGTYLFTNYVISGERLVALTAGGKFKCNIPWSNQCSSFDLVCIDDNTVAITTGESEEKTGVIIFDLTKRINKHFVALPTTPFGITYDGKSLICCCATEEIHVISCTDYSITTITNTVLPVFSYIATHVDRILYTNPMENKVTCCLYSGQLVWEFKNENVLRTPQGITVDEKGNVFVVGLKSQNILVIARDGKSYKEIKTTHYGLPQPSTIFFDKIRKQMLVTNEDSFAHLYDISFS